MSKLSDKDQTDLKLLMAKYPDDMEREINPSTFRDTELSRENAQLKQIVSEQQSKIDQLTTKHHDLSIEYNCKIDRLRDEHMEELANLHDQFKQRMTKELHKNTPT